MKLNYHRPKLTNYQKAIIDSKSRFTVCEASTKVGKTACHIIWLLEQALQGKAGNQFWWIAPVYSQAAIAFKRMKRQISVPNFFQANESNLTLTIPFNGAVLAFKSADNPDNLYGDDVYAAVFDEFTRAKEDAWFAIRSTLTKTKGKCKLIGNVKGKGNWGHNLAMRARQGEPDYEYFKITAYDAVTEGILDIAEIEQAKRDLPEYVFQELYLAEASEDGSNPFGLNFIKQCIQPISNKQPVCYGIDVAKSFDYTVIIGIDQEGVVCYFDRFQNDWQSTKTKIISLIKNTPCAIDSTGVGDPIFEDIKRQCMNVEGYKFSQTSKQQLIEGLAVSIQEKNIKFPEGIITDELSIFEYEYTRTGVKYSAPSGLHDDSVCALALANYKWKQRIRSKSFLDYI